MTFLWTLVFLLVGLLSGWDLPALTLWDGWTVTLLIAVALDLGDHRG